MLDAFLKIQVYTVELFAIIEISAVQIMLALAILGFCVNAKQGVRNSTLFTLFFISILLKPTLYSDFFKDFYYLAFAVIYLLLALSAWFFGRLEMHRTNHSSILLVLGKISLIDRVIVYLYVTGILNNCVGQLYKQVIGVNDYKAFYSVVSVNIDAIAIILLAYQIGRGWFKND